MILYFSKRIHADISFGANMGDDVPASRTTYLQGNIINFNKASWTKMRDSEPHLGNFSHYSKVSDMSVGHTESGFLPGNFRNTDDSVHTQNSSEALLQSLREFISEQHGVSIEDWRAEARTSPGNNESYAIYYSPDGKVFESMSDVAYFLGLMSEKNPGTTTSQKKFQSKKRKILKNSLENERSATFINRAVHKDASLRVQGIGPHANALQDNINYNPNQSQNGDSDWQQFNVSCMAI